MNPALTPAQRADLVLQQMTLDEKLALLTRATVWPMPRNGRCR